MDENIENWVADGNFSCSNRINIITLIGILIPLVSPVAQYTCQFGPDADGKYVEEVVDSKVALNCDSFCTCVGF